MGKFFLHSSSEKASDSTGKPTPSALRCQSFPGSRGQLQEETISDNKTLQHATQLGETCHSKQKISATTSSVTSGHLTLHTSGLLITVCEAQLYKRLTKSLQRHELMAKILIALTTLNKESVRKSCKKFQNRLEARVESNVDLFSFDLEF